MLFNRVRSQDDEGIMYHYCSGDTFRNVLQNRTLRFTDINLLNDAEEGRWGYSVFIEAANRILKREQIPNLLPPVPVEFIDKIDTIWNASGLALSSFVACFSTDGDSLSQWRAYADDGRGFAIGFRARDLRKMPIQILDVLYDREEQLKEMIVSVGALFMEMDAEGKHDDQSWFFERCMLLIASSIALKNPAWRDEKEVRCHHVVNVDISGPTWKILDAGEGEGDEVGELPIQFQVRDGTIVPFFDMPFVVSEEKREPVVEIVLGPKCPNGYGNVRFLLGNSGYGPITLKSAGGAYR